MPELSDLLEVRPAAFSLGLGDLLTYILDDLRALGNVTLGIDPVTVNAGTLLENVGTRRGFIAKGFHWNQVAQGVGSIHCFRCARRLHCSGRPQYAGPLRCGER